MRLRPALLLLCALTVIAPGPYAFADEPVASGWWYRLQSGVSPVAIPAPPDAPPDGLYVALDPSGPLAVAAVSYAGSANSQGGTLTLRFASAPSGTPTIDACVATAAVTGASAGAWEKQPSHDCDAGRAEGSIAPDGSSITFTLTSEFLTAAETVDAVLVPTGAAPFTAPIAKPGAESFVPVTASAGDDGGFVPDAGGGFKSDPGTSLGGDGATGEPLTPDGAFGGSTPLPGAPTTGDENAGGSPDAGGGEGSDGGGTPVAGGPIAADDESQLPKTVAVALLGALGAAYWYLSNRAEPAPRLIGGLTSRKPALDNGSVANDTIVPIAVTASRADAAASGRRTPHLVGGLGRFARPREKLPTRL